ncbi:uncharacterized protein LOC116948173 [Petromyzon marinus]|uniref:Autotransporter adhesin BpaC-like n=1 Tax=Petromyzon marinus TaxID=7757 RepID=A0AAJ7X492_PETMA|nr:autotransporter adhesin BpaC-like [Petromyzon marinus]
MAIVTSAAKCLCVFVTIVLGASEVATAANMRPLRGYHLCRGEVLVNRTTMVSYTESFAKLSLCHSGWLAHVCYKTGYRVAYRPVVRTQLENDTVCCAGYERSGSYCVLPLTESSVFTSKAGGCPASPPGGSTAPCAKDGDCGNATKCCPDTGGGGGRLTCAPPVPQANTGYYDIELTTTIEYSADLLDPHSASFLEAARLVHSMVSGLLESWNATGVYVTAFAPCTLGFWRSTEAKLRVAFSPPRTDRLALGMKLQKLPFKAPRVMFARVADVNECNAPELNSCQSGTNCVNRIGTYECKGNPVVAPTTAEPHSSGTPPWNSSLSPSAPYPPPTTPCGPDPLAPPYAVVTGFNAVSFGLSWDAGWTQQQRQLQQSYELKLSAPQSEGLEPTTLYSQEPRYNFTGLRPGVVYTVAITSRRCGRNSSTLVQRVKTESQELVGSVRVINRNFTAAMANTSSAEFANFSRELIAEILAGLPPNVAALVANGLLTITVKELYRGSIVAIIDLLLGGRLTGLTFDQVLLTLGQALQNSMGLQFDLAGLNVTDTNECANSTLNDCAENATCANTQGSYNCTCNAGFTDPSSVVAGRTCLANTNTQPSSTVAPGGSTPQPNVTTAASSANSTVPGATTQPNNNATTAGSGVNSTVPGATTQPNITTPASGVNSTVSGATPQPNATTAASSANSTVPGATTQPNNITTPASSANSTVPGATTQPNNVTTPASGVNSTVPGATTQPNNITTPASSGNSTVSGATTQPNNITTPASSANSTVPGATTQPNNITTPASGVNSTVPGATNQPNNITTPASSANSTVPGATTQPNNITTPASGANSTVPGATTQPNNVTTAASGVNSTVPGATTQPNNITTPASSANSTVPGATTQPNNITTAASGVNSTVPGATTQPNNNATTAAAGSNTTVPGATIQPNNATTTTTATAAAGGNNTTVPAATTKANDTTTTTTAPASASNVSSTAAPHPPSTLPTAYPASAMTVTCDGSYLYVRMPKAKLALSGVQPADVYLGLRSCGAQQGATSDSLEFKSGWSDCGTKVNSNITHTLLTNTLKSGVAAGEPSLLSITVFCALSNNVNASMGFPASGGFVINDTVYGTGWYSVSLQMWQNNSSLSTAPVLGTNDKLVLKVNIASANAHITAVMQTCWATPGPSQTDAQRMELITNKCATTNTDLKIIESGTSTAASFELTLYKYVTYAMTYIHCSIGICLTTAQNCKPVCSGSSRASYVRSERESSPNDNVIDMGPFRRLAATTAATATATEPTTGTQITPWRIATIVLGVLLGVALLILLAIAAYRVGSCIQGGNTAHYAIEDLNNTAYASSNAITNRNYRVL